MAVKIVAGRVVNITTLEEKIATAEAWLRNDIQAARREWRQQSTYQYDMTSTDLYSAIAKAKVETPKRDTNTNTFTSKGRVLEYGKTYMTRGIAITIWDPAKLSKKQWKVVKTFAREVGYEGSPSELAPWIDAIFSLRRGEIILGHFKAITGLDIQVSTWNKYSEHNL